ncbi:Z1 domain-containing protein [Streptomyces sp. CAI-121]|uniref:Z1 domain-containing protein n=1 Tax=unclassified Streptomyces TaxID=2593676 RepID=UPI001587CE60|nr:MULTISPECIES: Z1 domain-containing protein [unclassified Streptomyces]NUV70164.1 Z1 domain-containing protein [Streptomyces sp. CAI-121]NUW16082.1 Z1 domain-containing protein [Streptomyces sp. CAI-68]
MTDHLLRLHGDVLAAMRRGPRNFAKLTFALADDEEPADTDQGDFRDRVTAAGAGDELTALWHRTLTGWDLAEQADWSTAPPRTDERRADAYDRLGFDTALRKVLDHAVPVFKEPGPTIISTTPTWWYSRDTAAVRSFYWSAYEQLLRRKGWSDAAVAGLDEASHAVVERLADPTRPDAYGARGLVVGYVQSGKTANFTGVTAKAIDAGYRLVIVLGGTLNLLRGQTQRRLDMELIGQENILRGADPADPEALIGVDYQDDEDWPEKFVSHQGRPSVLGAFDIERLTTRDDDYKSLATGIRALEFDKQIRTQPLYAPDNLHRAAARVMVVKKNKSVLSKLIKDLKKIGGPLLSEIPTLIIDDESDQASVNTTDPKKWEEGKVTRTAINGQISQLLGLLPRAQYVGYTATPFANVFVDPGDGDDIFPRDFLISLPRPTGYMGVQDFHDLDRTDESAAGSAERAHVRGIYDDAHGDRLAEALDAFILTGALKLYRASHDPSLESHFRHHTMLVHESVRMAEHADLALRISSMWHQAGYTSQEGHSRLEALFTSDFLPFADAGLRTPASYEELRPHVARARQLINSGGTPVLVVNGDTERDYDQPDLDFDRTPNVWKILVGGTKLSRGFTVEGLTVTYYRRRTQQADTLMQMGRWFGFRPGYRDLVRLYIGRAEPAGKTRTVDLYEAFEAICRDEETFRAQLTRYATLVDGKPQVTPAQIPPLVSQHLSWLKPSARNKMFNAELVEIRSPGEWVEPTAYPTAPADLRHNAEVWRPVLDLLGADPITLRRDASAGGDSFEAQVGTLDHEELLKVLCDLRWSVPSQFSPHLESLLSTGEGGEGIDDWLVVLPRQTSSRRVEASVLGSAPLSLAHRSRRRGDLFGAIGEPKHREAALRIARASDAAIRAGDETLESLAGDRRGVVVLYPVVEEKPPAVSPTGAIAPEHLVMAFGLVAPGSSNAPKRNLVRFRTIDSTRGDFAIIERGADGS